MKGLIMKKFKLLSALSFLSLAILITANFAKASFRATFVENNLKIVDRAWINYKITENTGETGPEYSKKIIFEFKDWRAFSFSKDGKYVMVERSEYNSQVNAQNDYIEIFDLANKKRIFYMPFISKCKPRITILKTNPPQYVYEYTHNIGNLVSLKFYDKTLVSVDFNFEGNYINIPAHIYDVKSVYASKLSSALSVKFNDGSVKLYLPKKDFSRFSLLAEFWTPAIRQYDRLSNIYGGYWEATDKGPTYYK